MAASLIVAVLFWTALFYVPLGIPDGDQVFVHHESVHFLKVEASIPEIMFLERKMHVSFEIMNTGSEKPGDHIWVLASVLVERNGALVETDSDRRNTTWRFEDDTPVGIHSGRSQIYVGDLNTSTERAWLYLEIRGNIDPGPWYRGMDRIVYQQVEIPLNGTGPWWRHF